MKKILGALAALFASVAFGATNIPVPLISAAGSSSGQAIISTGTSSTWGGVGVNGIAAIAANTVIANATASSASPTAFAMPSCSTSASALNWTTSTGFTCNSAINAAQLGGTAAASYALLASPTFTGTPAAPTATAGTSTTQIATTAFVANSFAPLASPALTGTPTAPTATAGTNTTQLATTAFAQNAVTGGGNAGSFTTLAASGLISPTSSIGIKGTTTNDSAQAGSDGEYNTVVTSATSITSATATNITSVSLAAGDYDVSGDVCFNPAASTVTTQMIDAITTTSATIPAAPDITSLNITFPAGLGACIPTPVTRESLSSTTTVYLVAQTIFTTSTMQTIARIRWRRVR